MEFFLSVLPWIIVILLVLIVLGSCIKVVPQSRAFVVERLGAFRTVVGRGPAFQGPAV